MGKHIERHLWPFGIIGLGLGAVLVRSWCGMVVHHGNTGSAHERGIILRLLLNHLSR